MVIPSSSSQTPYTNIKLALARKKMLRKRHQDGSSKGPTQKLDENKKRKVYKQENISPPPPPPPPPPQKKKKKVNPQILCLLFFLFVFVDFLFVFVLFLFLGGKCILSEIREKSQKKKVLTRLRTTFTFKLNRTHGWMY